MKAAVVHWFKPAIIVEERPILTRWSSKPPSAPRRPDSQYGLRATGRDWPMERALPFVRGDRHG